MRYFIMNEGAQQGPYSIYDLKDLSIDANAFVREEDSNEWMRAKDVDELRRFLGFTDNKPLPKLVQAVEAVPVEKTRRRKSHTGCIVFLLLFIILAGAMVVTNPDKERHTQVISERMGSIIEATLLPQQQSQPDNLGEALIRGGIDILKDIFGSKTTQNAIASLLDYHNYYLFSTTSIQLFEKSQTISIGVFGHVITLNEDDIKRFSEKNAAGRIGQSITVEPERKTEEKTEQQEQHQTTPEDAPQLEEETRKNDIVNDIEQEVIRSIGNIARRQVEQRTDSTTGSALGKVIDGVTDILKEHVK